MSGSKIQINPFAFEGKSLQAAKKMSPQWADQAIENDWTEIQKALKEAGKKGEPKKKKESAK